VLCVSIVSFLQYFGVPVATKKVQAALIVSGVLCCVVVFSNHIFIKN